MPNIAARKPQIITENSTSIYYTITGYPINQPGQTTVFNVAKSSFQTGTPEDLSVNLSTFAFPLFSSEPNTSFPTTIEDAADGIEVGLDVFNGISTTTYNAFYGWDNFTDGMIGLSSTVERCITLNSKQYVTAKIPNTATITWTTDTGKVINIPNPNESNSQTTVFPAIPAGITLDETDNLLTIEGKDSIGEVLWTLNYHITCAWDEPITIAFINRFGVWETFDCLGRIDDSKTFERNSHIDFHSGGISLLSANGEESIEVNTGWVSEEFYNVLSEMMVSTSVVVYKGDSSTYHIVPEDNSIRKQTSRADGMINYTLKFKKSNPIIPII